MSKNEVVVSEIPDIFHLLESKDEEMMLQEWNQQMANTLIYQVKAFDQKTKQYVEKNELSYAGINYLSILMSQKLKQGLKIVYHYSEVKNIGGLDRWFAKIIYKNEVTGFETIGTSEQTVNLKEKKKDSTGKAIWHDDKKSYEYIFEKYDDFGERKAMSKAQRNAMKLQFPPKLVLDMIQMSIKQGKTESVNGSTQSKSNSDFCTCNLEQRQVTPDKGGCSNCQKSLTPLVAEELRKK